MKIRYVGAAMFALWAMTAAGSEQTTVSLKDMKGQKVAAMVYPENDCAKPLQKSAQSRLESIMQDNGITVLDQNKADELKDVFKGLENPGVFVTAETFVDNAGKFDIKALTAIYVSADVAPGLADYFSATAHADVRVIDSKDAKVAAITTVPMGVRGSPPSDGLTKDSALVNAIYRAVDSACERTGLEISDRTRSLMIRLKLEGPVTDTVSGTSGRAPENDASLPPLAKLEAADWRKEEATCTAKSPDGGLAAVAGYIKDTDFQRQPPRLYGSRLHLVDLETKRELDTFECSPVETKTRSEKGTKQVLDCMFLSSWRYLAAVTGNDLFLWDTETGQVLSKIHLEKDVKSATLDFVKTEQGAYLVVRAGKAQSAYRVVREQ